jgi:hypothetical protein
MLLDVPELGNGDADRSKAVLSSICCRSHAWRPPHAACRPAPVVGVYTIAAFVRALGQAPGGHPSEIQAICRGACLVRRSVCVHTIVPRVGPLPAEVVGRTLLGGPSRRADEDGW